MNARFNARAIATLVLAGTLLAGTARSVRASTSGPPVEIYAILSTSGPGAFFGQAEARALKVVEATVNAGSGIHGRPVEFTILDDQTNPQTTVQLASQIVAKNVPLFLGPSTPAACFAIAPMIEKTGPVGMCLNPSGHPAPGSFQFALYSDSAEVAIAFLRYFREHGITRVAMLDATDASGHDADVMFEKAFRLPENRTLVKVAEEHYSPSDISVTAQLARIKAANAQAIVSFNNGLPFGTVLRGMRDAGIDIPVATTGGNMTFGQMQQYAAFLPQDLLFGGTLAWAPGEARALDVRQAQLAYIAALDKAAMRPEGGYATIWDPALLAVATLGAIGPDGTAASARASIGGVRGWAGIEGNYDFRRYPQRGVGADATLIMRWDVTKKTFVSAGQLAGVVAK